MAATYSIELKLEGRKCLVVGGGAVAARKVKTLVRAGAEVHVVAPVINAAIRAIDAVQCFAEPYSTARVKGALLVFACTNDPEVNRRIAADARSAGAWVNVGDDPANCDFFVPAALERGDFRITVSTAGASPQLAATVRRRLESLFGGHYAILVQELRTARAAVQQRISDAAVRRQILETLCSDASIGILAAGKVDVWRALCRRLIDERASGGSQP
jgi:precorrin-2 dehydrogenase/sirohydrochlorin ferrochelatase